ncbi:unnamed protein product [Choristocarpus tenellus]
MGNGQSSEDSTAPKPELRLSSLCEYSSPTDREERGNVFWFQNARDTSGLVLGGAHRWGYLVSRCNTHEHIFQDTKFRFFVLVDRYLSYFDSHAQDARIRGSVNLDKDACQLELLPQSTTGEDEQSLEISKAVEDWSMVISFSSSAELQVGFYKD